MKSGKLSEQEGNERLAKIHEYIRQEIYLVDDNGE